MGEDTYLEAVSFTVGDKYRHSQLKETDFHLVVGFKGFSP